MKLRAVVLAELRERQLHCLKQAEDALYQWAMAGSDKDANAAIDKALRAAQEEDAYDNLICIFKGTHPRSGE